MNRILVVLLCATFSSVAFGQQSDDPGLAAPPSASPPSAPPPSTPPATAPTPAAPTDPNALPPSAPVDSATPPTSAAPSAQPRAPQDPATAAPTAPATTAPAAAAPAAAAPAAAAPTAKAPAAGSTSAKKSDAAVDEKVDVKVEWVTEDVKSPSFNLDFYDRLAAPAIAGGVGLLHTLTGDIGKPGTLRIALHLGGFQQDSFLVAGNASIPGDTNQHFGGDLSIAYTPWKYIEAYLTFFNNSNRNVRTDVGRSDPEVILALGDMQLGAKGHYTVAKFIDLGLHLGVKFLNSVSGVSFDGDSTNFLVDAIVSADLRRIKMKTMIPLRFHFNLGFLLDNSLSLLPPTQCENSTMNDACIRSRVVETYAYGIGSSRLKFALAADSPITVKNVGIQPFVEYHLEVAVGDGDQTVLRALRSDPTLVDRLDGQTLQYMTFGLRVRPVGGLLIDAALDVGLQSPGFIYGAPVPAWTLTIGAGWAFDVSHSQSKTKVITKTVTREINRKPVEGRVRGVVHDAVSKQPIAGATIRYMNRPLTPQASDADGTFFSYGLEPGPVTIEVSKDGFKSATQELAVAADAEATTEILLTAEAPQPSILKVNVLDENGAPATATVRLTAGAGSIVEAEMDKSGGYVAKVPAGDYTMDVEAPNMKPAQRTVTVVLGQTSSIDLVLQSAKPPKKPGPSHVNLTKTEIVIKGKIHFKNNGTEIAADGEQLLDEVVDVMQKNPQIKMVRVEGHTDNTGTNEHNMELSTQRAENVASYLVKQGVSRSRLQAEGFGSTQPLVPNLTPANKARNRRVTFRIVGRE